MSWALGKRGPRSELRPSLEARAEGHRKVVVRQCQSRGTILLTFHSRK